MENARTYDVQVTIVEMQKGPCSQGFKIGDSWFIKGNLTPANMCQTAFDCMYPAIRTMRYGGEIPWSKNRDVVRISCPDPMRVVVYELRRIPNPDPIRSWTPRRYTKAD